MTATAQVLRLAPQWGRAQRGPDTLYERLRSAIVRLEYKPGQAIYENALAQQSGLSRTPVRDALKRLRDEGLVEIRAGAGSFVAPIDVGRLDQAIRIRTFLEGEAAACGARDPRAAELHTSLVAIILAQRAAQEAGDLDGVYRFDGQFHEALFAFSNLDMMWSAVRTARAEMDRIHYIARDNPQRRLEAIDFHGEIADAIARRDEDGARSFMSAHIDTNRSHLMDIAARHPEYLRQP